MSMRYNFGLQLIGECRDAMRGFIQNLRRTSPLKKSGVLAHTVLP
jgi:hypothetical protein